MVRTQKIFDIFTALNSGRGLERPGQCLCYESQWGSEEEIICSYSFDRRPKGNISLIVPPLIRTLPQKKRLVQSVVYCNNWLKTFFSMISKHWGTFNFTKYFLPAKMSASSMKCVVNKTTRPFFFSFKTAHKCRLEKGSIPAVG
jgi:hypothetical protein